MKWRPSLRDLVSAFEIGTALYFGAPNNLFAQEVNQNRIYSSNSELSTAGEGVGLKDFVFNLDLDSDSKINLNDKFGLYAKRGDISYDVIDARKGLKSIISYLKKDLSSRDSQSKKERIATIRYYQSLLKKTPHNERASLNKLEKAVKDGVLDVQKESLGHIELGRYFIVAKSESIGGRKKNGVPIILDIKADNSGEIKKAEYEIKRKELTPESEKVYWRVRREYGKDVTDISSESEYSKEESSNEDEIEWEEIEYGDEIDWEKETPNIITDSKTKKRNNWDAFHNVHFGSTLGAVIDNYAKSTNPSGKPVGFKAARGGLELDAFLSGPNSKAEFDLRFLNDDDGYTNKTKEIEGSFIYTPRVINFEGASISPAGGVGLEGRVSLDNETISNELMNLRSNTQGEFREMIKWLGLGGKINAGDFLAEVLYKFSKGNASLKFDSETFQGTDLIAKQEDIIRTMVSGNAIRVGLGYHNGAVSLRFIGERGNRVYVPLGNNASIIDDELNVEYDKFEIEAMLNLHRFLIKTGFTTEEGYHAPFDRKDRTGASEKTNRVHQIGVGAGIKF